MVLFGVDVFETESAQRTIHFDRRRALICSVQEVCTHFANMPDKKDNDYLNLLE